MDPDNGPARVEAVDALRAWAASFDALGRTFSTHLGMHGSDATALVQITAAEERGVPLTQTQLAHGLGLTSPATSALIGRLEQAGHVERRRDRADRRAVSLRSTDAVHDEVRSFFDAVARDLDAVAGRLGTDELAAAVRMVTEMTAVLDRHIAPPPGRSRA